MADGKACSGPAEIEPKAGKILLRVEVVGSNPQSKPPKMYFGIDCVTLAKP